MREITVSLGGKVYTVRELPLRKNAAWRAEFQKPFGNAAEVIRTAVGLELNDGAGLAEIVQKVTQMVIGSVDVVTDLVFAYAPELAAKRAEIEADLYESEIQEAFAGVLGLAFPFAMLGQKLLTTVRQLNDLSANKPTLTN